MNESIETINRRRFLQTATLASLGLGLAPWNATAADNEHALKPNIVFLLVDDLGGGDLHCYGHPYSRTPNIDSLARDGTRFRQFYATGATCCPARTGLMTSKFPATYPTYPANGGFANHITITELLKKQGYATGHFGKWHIGPVQKAGTYSIDSIGSGEEEQGGKKKRDDDRGRDAHIYDAAIKFIEQHKHGPFYVNVWGHISHSPVNPTDALVKRLERAESERARFPHADARQVQRRAQSPRRRGRWHAPLSRGRRIARRQRGPTAEAARSARFAGKYNRGLQ